MRNLAIIILFFITISVNAQSQFDYKDAIGVRAGLLSVGVTYKHFLTENIAIDNWVTTRLQGAMYTGLIEFQKSNRNRKMNIANLNFYFGLGAHLLLFAENENTFEEVTTVGADIIIGFEKKISSNLVFGLDIKPQYEFLNPNPNELDFCAGISIRYML